MNSMSWYPTLIFYMGLFDAGIVMLGGVVVAAMFILKINTDDLMERAGPAVAVLIGTNIAAAIILGATRWLVG